MSFLEIVGVIACIVIFVYFANVFLDTYDKNNRELDENKRRLEKLSEEEEAKKEEYNRWASENPLLAKEAEEEKQKIREENDKFRVDLDNLHDLMVEMSYLKRAGRMECFEYLEKFKSIGPSKYWEGSDVLFPAEINYADNLTSQNHQSNNLPWSGITECSVSMNTKKLMEMYNIPESEMVNLYQHEKDIIHENGHVNDERPISTWHEYILGKIINDFSELKNIATKRNTTPIYSRRR